MQKLEYLFVSRSYGEGWLWVDDKKLKHTAQEKLNSLGENGLELVDFAISYSGNEISRIDFILKRPRN